MGTILAHNEQFAERWSAGGRAYDLISRQIADALEHGVDRLNPTEGDNILDLATGTGWTARRVALRGATVIACDFAAGVIEAAERRKTRRPGDVHPRSTQNRGSCVFEVADAESLPYKDGQFDGLISTFGVQFVTDPVAASTQMARVLKQRGRLVLTLWAKDSTVASMFKVIKQHMPPPPNGKAPPSPFDWGEKQRVRELLSDGFKLGLERATVFYRDKSPSAAWDAFVAGYGPVKMLAAKLDHTKREAFRRDFIAFHEQFQTDLGILVPRDYWIVYGERR